DPVRAADAELGLRGVIAGPHPVLEPNASLLALEPSPLILSAVKPAEDGDGVVVRVLNPTQGGLTAILRVGFPFAAASAVRLDESSAAQRIERAGDRVHFDVPAHALRSVWLR